jgi:hypothetical protein
MATPFVWFDLRTSNDTAARDFYAGLLDWEIGEAAEGGPAMIGGAGGPWGSISRDGGAGTAHWMPYVQVDDLDAATERAQTLGATVLQARTAGPAGHFTTIADPTGATIALWEPGPQG